MKIFSMFKKKKKVIKKRDMLKDLAMKKICKIEKEKFSKEKIEDVIFVFKVFLESKVGVKNNKTNEEIIDLIKNKKIKKKLKNKINAVLKLSNDLEYSGKEVNDKQLETVIINIKDVIEEF